MNASKQFDRLDRAAKLMAPPVIKFKDLEGYFATSKILTGPIFLFDVRTDYVKITNDTVLVPLTMLIHNKRHHLQYERRRLHGDRQHVLGRVSSLTGRHAAKRSRIRLGCKLAQRAARRRSGRNLRCTGSRFR